MFSEDYTLDEKDKQEIINKYNIKLRKVFDDLGFKQSEKVIPKAQSFTPTTRKSVKVVIAENKSKSIKNENSIKRKSFSIKDLDILHSFIFKKNGVAPTPKEITDLANSLGRSFASVQLKIQRLKKSKKLLNE